MFDIESARVQRLGVTGMDGVTSNVKDGSAPETT